MRKPASVIICSVCIMFLQISPSFAYLTENASGVIGWGRTAGTHNEFTLYSINKLDFDGGVQKALQDNQTSILGGNSAEDDDSDANALTHFYDPNWSGNQRGIYFVSSENAKTRAEGYYGNALQAYRDGKKSFAWERIGRALHLLQDMAAPSHVHLSDHYFQTVRWPSGYEWWVANNWDGPLQRFLLKPYLDKLLSTNPYFRNPIMAGDMGGYMDALAIQTRYGYDYDVGPIWALTPVSFFIHTVTEEESKHAASVLVPMAILNGGGLLQSYCKEVNCTGPTTPQANNAKPGGNPDDNFDVSSRLIELEELDVTKQAWKDLYSRTGIKKGYNELYLGKIVTEAYARLAATTAEAELNIVAQQFQTILARAQLEAKHSFEDTYYASADVALLSDAFVDNAAELLLKRLKEPIREVKETFTPAALLKNQPVLLIPSGALTGFNDSPLLKSSLDEYVKQGGTLIVLSQKHGYDYATIPTPDGRPITGYGWEEDINCFADAFTINTWHQMLSGQSSATPTANVDGYFTSIPDSSTVLLRRTANSQPALFMYPLGSGRVIVTSMYTDWAYGHGQASTEEIAMLRDMLSWAKKPAVLPEIKSGEAITVPVTVTNSSSTEAATVKLQIFTPDRATLLAEQTVSLSIQAGMSAQLPVTWQSVAKSTLGIYHIDYLLLDASGTIIQPQAETDSGRFVVSKPPTNLQKSPDYNFAVNSASEHYAYGSDAAFTVTLYNNTDTEKTITAKYFFPHHFWETGRADAGGDWNNRGMNLQKSLLVPAHGSVSFAHTLTNVSAGIDRLWAYFYDETGAEVGMASRGFWVFRPSVNVSLQTSKATYTKGETVSLALALQNKQSVATTANVTVRVSDPANLAVYNTTQNLSLSAGETKSIPLTFPLPITAPGGSYTISAEAFDTSNTKIGGSAASFELPLSQIAVVSVLPTALVAGANTVPFTLTNTGKIAVSSGTLDVTLKDPEGAVVAAVAPSFALDPGQATTVNATLPIPALKFGSYTLTYTQSDETKSSRPTTVSLLNTISTVVSFDKPSYRIRETATLDLQLANSGRFNLENATVSVTLPDAGFADTRQVTVGQGQTLPLQYAIPLADTLTAGVHGVSVAFTLPGGASLVKNATITVPQSSLALSLAQTAYAAGAMVVPLITNSGGVDTQVDYRLTLYDAQATLIADKRLTETVPANGSLPVSLPIPVGATDGGYVLVVAYNDLKTAKAEIVQKNLTISGIKAALTVRTDKQAYLSTDSITALSTITNNDSALQAGNLHLQVVTAGGSQLKKTWTSQYDFQQGIRSGVDTYSLADSVTLTAFSDNFDGGFLNKDRWNAFASEAGGAAPAVVNGRIYIEMPNAGYWPASTADLIAPVTGDFDVQVDYEVDSVNSADGSKHPAGMGIYTLNGMYLWVDLWGSMTYGTCDYGYQCSNAGGGQYTGKFRVSRTGSTYSTYYWNGSGWSTLQTTSNRPVGPTYIRLVVNGTNGQVKTYFDNFIVSTQTYPTSGTLNLKYDAGRSELWDKLSFNGDIPDGTAMKFRTRSAETESGLTGAVWSSYLTTSGSTITSPKGRWLEVETTLSTGNTATTPVLHELTITQGKAPGDILWQANSPVNLAPGALTDLNNAIGPIATAGKYYLQGTLFSSTGQTVATAEAPFYVAQGDTLLTYTADRKYNKPGETVTITGAVKNLAAASAANLAFTLQSKDAANSEQTLYANTFSLPAGASQPFSVTTTAGAAGVVALTGTVMQNSATVAVTADQYETAIPLVTATAVIPAIAGNDPVSFTLTLTNTGKIDATVTVTPSFTSLAEVITIPAGQTRLLPYSVPIAADTMVSFFINGDLTQTIAQPVHYGPEVTLAATPLVLYPEGKITLPVTVTNTGLIDSQFAIDYQLSQGANSINQQAKSYFLAKGASSSDNLIYDLPEGSYQLAATTRKPAASAMASFQVRKEIKADLTLAVGTQSNSLLPTTVNVTNLGYLPIDGSVRLSLIAANGTTSWSAVQDVSLPQALSPEPRTLPFAVNLAAVPPGSYTVRAELLDSANRQLQVQSTPFTLLGPVFELTGIPGYQTVAAGGSVAMTFTVKNSGNKEGGFDLAFKADDLTDSTRSEWLPPGAEKEITFNFQTAGDLDDKDYSTTWRLKSAGATVREGIVMYHLAGIKLAVTATLDKQNYNVGDTANFTLTVTDQNGGAAPGLFARVNYNGYNEKQSFTLNGSQSLVFNVPLTQITGEKLFYGIYSETGRSLHLNTIYLYKKDAELAVSTDKQVYNPGETVTAAISGSATGDLTLTGPGDFTTTFAYSGSETKSFTLPTIMTAGTYTLNAKRQTHNSGRATHKCLSPL